MQGSYGWAEYVAWLENSDTSLSARESGEGHVRSFLDPRSASQYHRMGQSVISPKEAAHTHTHSYRPPPLQTKRSDQRPGKRRPAAGQQIASGKPPRMPGWECLHCGTYFPLAEVPGGSFQGLLTCKYLGPTVQPSKTQGQAHEATTRRDQQPSLLASSPVARMYSDQR